MLSADAIFVASATMIAGIISLLSVPPALGLPVTRSFLTMIMLPMAMFCWCVILAMLGGPYSIMASGALFALGLVVVVFVVGFLQREVEDRDGRRPTGHA